MVNTLKLPVGIDSFEKIRRNGFYYIDKTNLIEQILMNWGEVTLFTRPRRFGKTLNMSMLKSFFEIGADVSLFEGLYIAKNKELCDAYMGKYPVIFLTLKGVEGLTFADAKRMLGTILANEIDRHYYLKTSDALTDEDKAYFAKMLTGTDENIEDSIRKLSQLLYKHHGKKAVIIIDEYDVPLDKAYQNGYYREMVSLIRGLFGQALKTNDYLQFAFLTGCLRVSMVFTAIPFASAATNANALDETKKVSFTLNCSKPGYTFTVYKVAELKTTENPYKTGYDSLIPSISDEILSGKTSNILSALDGLSSIPSTASTVGTFTTSATSVKKTFSSLAQGLYYIKATNSWGSKA